MLNHNINQQLKICKRQSRGPNLRASIRWWELECKKSFKIFCKIFEEQNIQNQINEKHSSNPEDIFKSFKYFLDKIKTKEDSSKVAISKVVSKIS